MVRMQHDGIEPNLQCFNSVIHGLGLAGEWKRAEAMMEVIHKTGLVPDSYTYNSMAMAYASVRARGAGGLRQRSTSVRRNGPRVARETGGREGRDVLVF